MLAEDVESKTDRSKDKQLGTSGSRGKEKPSSVHKKKKTAMARPRSKTRRPLKVAIEGTLDGKRGPGRPRLGMISEMGYYAKLKEDAVDREHWRRIIKRTFIP